MLAKLPPRIARKSEKADAGKRSPAHRAWVRGHQCVVEGCGGMPIECAHVRRASNSGVGFKPSDAFTVSLCKEHHAESHRGERTFEAMHGLDLLALAAAARDVPTTAENVLARIAQDRPVNP